MKAKYNKPVLNIESFALSQSIALSCGAAHDSAYGGPRQADRASCAWETSVGNLFTSATAACGIPIDSDAALGEMCYNAPVSGNNVFNS